MSIKPGFIIDSLKGSNTRSMRQSDLIINDVEDILISFAEDSISSKFGKKFIYSEKDNPFDGIIRLGFKTFKTQLDSLEDRNKELSDKVKANDIQIAGQKRKYEELSSQIVLKDEEVIALKRVQQELSDEVKSKDLQISELNEKIKKTEQQNVELSEDREQIIFNKTAEIVNQRNRIDELNTLKEKTIHSIVYLNGKLNEKDVQITNYKKDVSDLHDKLKAKGTECDIKTIDLRHAASYINDLKRLIEQQNTQIAIYSNTKHLEITKLKEENESLKKQINWLQLQIVTNEVDQPEEGAEPPRKKRRV